MKTAFKAALALLALGALVLPSAPAQANIAANTQVVNQASLSYNDGAATRTSVASVTVTVSLVPGNPNVTPGPPKSGPYSGPSSLLQNTFTVTNTGNGPDTFALSSAITGSTNTNNGTAPSATVSTPAAPGTLSLGATITVAGSTASAIKVPSDGTADSVVNGIAKDSIVQIGTDVATVLSVSDPGGSGIATINLVAPLAGGAPGIGVVVGEQKTVTVDVTAGAIATPGSDITVSKNLTVTSTHLGSASTTSASITDTYSSGLAKLTKYVRIVKASPPAGTGLLNHNGADYYQGGISAQSGDVLEYLLVANNSGSGQVTAAAVTDVLPTSYVTLKTGAYTGGKDLAYENEAGTISFLTAANDGDVASYTAGTILVNVGTGATPTNGSNLGGTIATGKSVYVYYQVTVN